MTSVAFRNCRVLARNRLCEGLAVVVNDGQIEEVCPEDQLLMNEFEVHDLDGMLLLPGFIDVQVNGGGGILFNSLAWLKMRLLAIVTYIR